MKKNIILSLMMLMILAFAGIMSVKAVVTDDSEPVACTMEYAPVCGVDGQTYSNKCVLEANNKELAYQGECQDENAVICTLEYMPVCGKDGVTYGNKCLLNAAKQELAYQGECSDANIAICTREYKPVCAKDGKTYSNECVMKVAKQELNYVGECKDNERPRESSIEEIRRRALMLRNNINNILAEIKEVRNEEREAEVLRNQLKSIASEINKLNPSVQVSINAFVAYGVDENTKQLGEGERAAVVHSFRAAYNKLPETEDDIDDIVRIANGRWPKNVDEESEARARELFKRIYLREVNNDNPRDVSALKIMAYGLRQRAENRNLESEKNGIAIFRNIFKKMPVTTEEWNIMQAITYSGAAR